MKKSIDYHKEECGQSMVLFAFTLVILIFFVGLSVDMNMLYMRRNAMENVCQVIRDNRFTYQDTIRYAENPAEAMYNIVSDTLADNGYDADTAIKVYFYEKPPEAHYRYYRVRTEISEEFEWNFLKIFGVNKSVITVHLDGGEAYGDGAVEVVWHPATSTSEYNGCYAGTAGQPHEPRTNALPSDW